MCSRPIDMETIMMTTQLASVIFLVVLTSHTASSFRGATGDYCADKPFEASCPTDTVILMHTSLYGLLEIGKCMKKDYGFLGCNADVFPVTDTRCSGRRSCVVQHTYLRNQNIAPNPCPPEFAWFLRANYECLPVLSADRHRCRMDGSIEVTQDAGYIASVVTAETACGSGDVPWVIRASPGQTINITLHDFAYKATKESYRSKSRYSMNTGQCVVYAILQEQGSDKTTTVCGGRYRTKHIYTSTSHVVEARIVSAGEMKDKYFMLEYKAVGCPKLVVPAYGWVTRDGKKATVGCNNSGQSWKIECDGDKWIGDVGTCDVGTGQVMMGSMSLPRSLFIIIIVTVIILIGLLFMCFGYLAYNHKKRQKQHQRMRAQVPMGKGKATDKTKKLEGIEEEEETYDRYDKANFSSLPRMPAPVPPKDHEYEHLDDFMQDGIQMDVYETVKPTQTIDTRNYGNGHNTIGTPGRGARKNYGEGMNTMGSPGTSARKSYHGNGLNTMGSPGPSTRKSYHGNTIASPNRMAARKGSRQYYDFEPETGIEVTEAEWGNPPPYSPLVRDTMMSSAATMSGSEPDMWPPPPPPEMMSPKNFEETF